MNMIRAAVEIKRVVRGYEHKAMVLDFDIISF